MSFFTAGTVGQRRDARWLDLLRRPATVAAMPALRPARRREVALLIETSNAYARGLLQGVVHYIREHQPWSFHLMEQGRGDDPPAWLAGWKGDGIIARIETPRIAAAVIKAGLPAVDLSAARLVPGLPWVETDDAEIARLAAEHLLERGFRPFAFFGVERFNWSVWREEHFAARVRAAGHDCHAFRPKTKGAAAGQGAGGRAARRGQPLRTLLREKGTHHYDLAYWLARSEPVEIYAAGGCLFDPGFATYGDVDTAALTLRFASGALATFSFSRRTAYGCDESIEVFGSKGMLQSRAPRPRSISLYQGGRVIDDGIDGHWYDRFASTYVAELDALIAAVRAGVAVEPTLVDGMRAQAIAEGAVESLTRGVPVQIANVWQA